MQPPFTEVRHKVKCPTYKGFEILTAVAIAKNVIPATGHGSP
jgi:hypothetical protein